MPFLEDAAATRAEMTEPKPGSAAHRRAVQAMSKEPRGGLKGLGTLARLSVDSTSVCVYECVSVHVCMSVCMSVCVCI